MYVDGRIALGQMKLSNYRNQELDMFKTSIEKYKSQRIDFNTIPLVTDVGIVRVNSTKLKAMFVPAPAQCLEALYRVIPVIAQEKNDALLNEL